MYMGALLVSASLLLSACGTSSSTGGKDGSPQQPASGSQSPSANDKKPEESTEQVTVYRGNQDASDVVKESATMPKTTDAEKRVLQLLDLLKEQGSNSVPSFPQRVKVLGTPIADGVLTLNLSQEAQSMSSAEEIMFLKAIPQTIFDNDQQVKTIKFQVNGKDVDTLTQMDVSKGISK